MSGKKSTLRTSHHKKKQLRKPKVLPSQEISLRKSQKKAKNRTKLRKEKETKEDEESESEESDEGEEAADDILLTKETEGERGQFNFEFSDMKADFYGGIQLMLAKQLYSTVAAHDLTEVIIQQDELGTVVHCEGESDVFAYASILPAVKIGHIEFLKQLANYVNHHAQATANQECKNILNSIASQDVDAAKYGVLYHDRYVNLPLELINMLHHNLSDDLTWILDATQRNSEIAAELVEAFEKMEYIILFRPVAPEADTSSSSSASSSDVKIQNVTGSSSVMFDYFEDDVYFEHAEHAWKMKLDPKLFKASNQIMMIIPKQNIAMVANGLQAMLS